MMMAPKCKLIYVNGRGLAEPARFLLKYGNVEFEDARLKKEDWSQITNILPFGQIPVLQWDGKVVGQSVAICRYLANVVKLVGEDDWENLEIDATVETLTDLRLKLTPMVLEKDEEKKRLLKEKAVAETLPYYLTRLEARVAQNRGYLALPKLSWADLFFVSMSPAYDLFTGCDALESYPNLKNVREKVHSLPGIKEWLEVRPKTDF